MASFPAETITSIGSFHITNTFLHTLIVDALLVSGAVYLKNHLQKAPKKFQNAVEYLIEAFYNLTKNLTVNTAVARHIFPYVMTFFLFIFIANITSLFPGVGTIGFSEERGNVYASTQKEESSTTHSEEKEEETHFVPLLRGATSDINVTLALALISVFATHFLSIKLTGIKDYLGRYFSLNPINLYVGILEIVAEITKIVSLSFRLFGNIFAGEVALATVSKLFAFLFPLPFLLLESIVAVVQALVFSMLTLVFMAVLTTPHHAHNEEHVSNH